MNGLLLEIIGWAGSALLVISLLQSRMLTLRVLNLVAAIALIGYNVALAVWPSVAMNVAVAGIDLFYLIVWRVRRSHPNRTDTADPELPRTQRSNLRPTREQH